MPEKIKLCTGLYRCVRCGQEYDCIRMHPEQLTCLECGDELAWVDPVQIFRRSYPESWQIRRGTRRRSS